MDAVAARPARRVGIRTETLLRAALFAMNALSCLSFIEPSPYEFFFFLLVPIAMVSGLALTRTTLALFFLVFVTVVSQLVALVPYLQHSPFGEGNLTPSIYTIYTVYLYGSALLFALLFARNCQPRLRLCIFAYAISCVFAGLWGIASFLDIGGLGANEPILGRVAGPFKDPNVLGSYCILGALYFIQQSVLGRGWRRLASLVCLLIVLFGGVFLSFSRGSWAAMIIATLLMGISTFATAEDGFTRRRVRRSLVGLVTLGFLGGAAVLSVPALHDTVLDRAKVEQDYDGGETGRFGNQRRSMSMLIERPFGLGPFRFPLYFTLQPHNSYIGAFSDGGWTGGFAFMILVVSTTLIILRQLFNPSSLSRQAQVIGPALLGFFLQALQIDIDHWRFVFLMLGAVWGMQSALNSERARGETTARTGAPREQPA